MMKRVILALFALTLASATYAQPPGGGGPGGAAAGGLPDNATIMANNDGNKDGEITKAEAEAAAVQLIQNWDMFDTNGDGKVVAAELDAVRAGAAGGAGGAPGARAGGPGGARAGGPGGRAGGAPAAAADEEDEDEEDEE